MSRPDYINYVMLNGGTRQRVPAGAVDDTMVAMARAWMDRDGLHSGFIPGLPLDLVSTSRGSTVFCTIQFAGQPIAEYGVAKSPIGAAELWADLHAGNDLPLVSEPPSAPWVALVLLPAMRSHLQVVALTTVAVAKATAWALIEKRLEQ